MQRELFCHPTDKVHQNIIFQASINQLEASYLKIEYLMSGDIDDVLLNIQDNEPRFRNGLWKATCFEMFVGRAGMANYVECNFAPNGDWAVYHLDDYRQSMRNLYIKQPQIFCKVDKNNICMNVILDMSFTDEIWQQDKLYIGLNAILIAREGQSHWALKHTQDKADFHQKDCFLLPLEASKPL